MFVAGYHLRPLP